MGFRGMPLSTSGQTGFNLKSPVLIRLAWLASALLLVSACGSQEPAFTENRSARNLSSADATAQGMPDSLGSEADQKPIADTRTDGTDSIGDADGSGGKNGGGDADGTGSSGNSGKGGDDNGSGGSGGNDGGSNTVGGGDGTSNSGNDGAGTGDNSGDNGGNGGNGDTGSNDDGANDDGTGTGDEDGLAINFVTMNLTQQGAGKVDILWIIDTSGSMAEEQSYLGANFNALITQLATAGHDFQTAVTTTDICQNTLPPLLIDRACPLSYGGSAATHLRGSFVGETGRKVLKQGDTDLVSRFNTYVNQGINGSGFEHGLEAAELAISKSLSGENEALVRSDAFLAVIVVSDEEDDGIGLGMPDAYTGYNFIAQGLTSHVYTEDNMIDYLKTAKGEGNFSVSAITSTRNPDGSLCSSPHSQPAEEGTQYIKAVSKTGGILQSICEPNWNTSLSKIGVDLNAQLTQVALEYVPNEPTIKVFVDNVQTFEWTYNAGNNAVKFNADHVPEVGAQIKVTYYKQ